MRLCFWKGKALGVSLVGSCSHLIYQALCVSGTVLGAGKLQGEKKTMSVPLGPAELRGVPSALSPVLAQA